MPRPVPPEFVLRDDDILLSRSGTSGRTFLVPPEATGLTFAGFLVRFRPSPDVDPRFLGFALRSDAVQAQIQADAITSTIQNFNAERYANLTLWCPSLVEQRRIADFLDELAPAAQLGHLGPVTGETARRFACDAHISRVITDGPCEVVDVGRKTRSIGPGTRRALIVRDGGCRYPGCDRGSSWCECHHRTHWVDGGDTDLVNLVMLCRRHHRLLHEGRRTLHPKPDGSWALAPYEPPAQPPETSVGSYGDSSEPADDLGPASSTSRRWATVSQEELDEFWGIERDDDGVPLVAPRAPKPPPREPPEDPF